MSLLGLLEAAVDDPGAADLVQAASASAGLVDVVAPPGIRPTLLAALAAAPPRGAGCPLVVVTTTGREAEGLAEALRCYLPEHAVAEFPSWETLPHERLSPRSDTVGLS